MNNTDNWLSLARTALKVVGTIAVTTGVAEAGQVDALTTALLTGVGGIVTAIGIFWSIWEHTPDEAPK